MTGPVTPDLARLLGDRDPLAAARAAGVAGDGPIRVRRGPAPAGWLVDSGDEGGIDAHSAAHAEGRPSEAVIVYGNGRGDEEIAARLSALADLAAATGLLRAVTTVPADGDTHRPGSWGVEDLTVVATCRAALPDTVAVRPSWERLGPAACQIAVAFGATGRCVPADDPTDLEHLAGAIGRTIIIEDDA
ncbi:MAG: hypothetical protein ACLGG9_05060 [Thermoleophilia bacterium]